ncbi:unnamed protein product [Soboliphyme baturini]|uniref:Uncharacterized protein n=1 Tax=Soboliphyme baturini TaxID=241478 RepID=A0A183IKP4_9BILA|nr:unnamed protein product [Soboliphyme baturini]
MCAAVIGHRHDRMAPVGCPMSFTAALPTDDQPETVEGTDLPLRRATWHLRGTYKSTFHPSSNYLFTTSTALRNRTPVEPSRVPPAQHGGGSLFVANSV